MKIFRPFLAFLLFAVGATIVLSLVVPAKQKVNRTITINAPANIVFAEISKLSNLNQWWIWNQTDSTAHYSLTGEDGTVGASSTWKGSSVGAGEGNMEITELQPGKMVVYTIHFTSPKKKKASSKISLVSSSGITSVTWDFEIPTPRPWNISNLFSSLDKQMGDGFDSSLAALKKICEKTAGKAPDKVYDVSTMNFPASKFAMIRQQVKWSDMADFFRVHIPLLLDSTSHAGIIAGTPAGLFFDYDEKNQVSDLAAAVPVPVDAKMEGTLINTYDIPASKAIFVNYEGNYNGEPAAYNSLNQYLSDNKLKKKGPAIEQYLVGPYNEKDTSKWLTKIVMIVE
jgi:effector-binding domain-containing protein/uncharacterized protein YndB with AHSA1/START domain